MTKHEFVREFDANSTVLITFGHTAQSESAARSPKWVPFHDCGPLCDLYDSLPVTRSGASVFLSQTTFFYAVVPPKKVLEAFPTQKPRQIRYRAAKSQIWRSEPDFSKIINFALSVYRRRECEAATHRNSFFYLIRKIYFLFSTPPHLSPLGGGAVDDFKWQTQ